jgi:hypothetical protein
MMPNWEFASYDAEWTDLLEPIAKENLPLRRSVSSLPSVPVNFDHFDFNRLGGIDLTCKAFLVIPGTPVVGISTALHLKTVDKSRPAATSHMADVGFTNPWFFFTAYLNGDFSEMTHTRLQITTFSDIMSLRAITGVLRIVEHHLANGISTGFLERRFACQEFTLETVEEIAQYLESLEYVIEYSFDKDLPGFNAYRKRIHGDNEILTSAIRVNVNGTKFVYAAYFERKDQPKILQELEWFKKWEVEQPVKLSLLTNIDCNGKGTVTTREIVPGKNIPHDVNYPYLDGGVDAYIEGFFQSNANMTLLLGPYGTGKSSLLAQICRAGDSKGYRLLQIGGTHHLRNAMFPAYFMSIPDNTLVIFEDVDTLLAPREGQDGNELMSMLLNELQGIASKKIKLVITTNLSTRNKIDQALIRPGRCYKAVETRELTSHEATRVVNHYELPESCATAGTLAEIFEGRMKKVRVGFSPE